MGQLLRIHFLTNSTLIYGPTESRGLSHFRDVSKHRDVRDGSQQKSVFRVCAFASSRQLFCFAGVPSPGYRRADKFVGVPGSVPYRPLSIEMSNTLPLPTYLEDNVQLILAKDGTDS